MVGVGKFEDSHLTLAVSICDMHMVQADGLKQDPKRASAELQNTTCQCILDFSSSRNEIWSAVLHAAHVVDRRPTIF